MVLDTEVTVAGALLAQLQIQQCVHSTATVCPFRHRWKSNGNPILKSCYYFSQTVYIFNYAS